MKCSRPLFENVTLLLLLIKICWMQISCISVNSLLSVPNRLWAGILLSKWYLNLIELTSHQVNCIWHLTFIIQLICFLSKLCLMKKECSAISPRYLLVFFNSARSSLLSCFFCPMNWLVTIQWRLLITVRQKSCGKVMFSGLCVCQSVYRGSSCGRFPLTSPLPSPHRKTPWIRSKMGGWHAANKPFYWILVSTEVMNFN